MKKIKLATTLAIFMGILILGQSIAQVHAKVTPITIVTEKQFNDQLTIPRKSHKKDMTIKRNINAKRTDTLVFGAWYTKITIKGTVRVNGKTKRFSFNTEEYPLDKIYETLGVERTSDYVSTSYYATSRYYIPHYYWDNINFLRSPGSNAWHVTYDHPNNVDNSWSSGRYYDVNPNEGTATTLRGGDRYHGHVPRWQLRDAKRYLNIWNLITGSASILAIIAGISLSVIGAAIVGVILGVLALFGIAIRTFIENVMETELLDGWQWLWGLTEHWFLWWRVGFSWWMSFGRWRDWGWFFYTPL